MVRTGVVETYSPKLGIKWDEQSLTETNSFFSRVKARGTYLRGGCVSPRAGLDVFDNR
jgi:hypothetical protein